MKSKRTSRILRISLIIQFFLSNSKVSQKTIICRPETFISATSTIKKHILNSLGRATTYMHNVLALQLLSHDQTGILTLNRIQKSYVNNFMNGDMTKENDKKWTERGAKRRKSSDKTSQFLRTHGERNRLEREEEKQILRKEE